MNTKTYLLATAMLVVSTGLTACGGGGGGGGGGEVYTPLPPTPPPPPPPPAPPPPPPPPAGIGSSDCATKPSAIACATSPLTLAGATAYTVTGLASAFKADDLNTNATVTLSAGSSGTAGDETYRVVYKLNGQTYDFEVGGTGESFTTYGFPTRRPACTNPVNCPASVNLIYAATAESGDLDYVLPYMLSNLSTQIYGVGGRETGPLTPSMQTGTALYAGSAFGSVATPTSSGIAQGRLRMDVNFATGAIDGAIVDFSTPVSTPIVLDFLFTGSLNNASGRFTGSALARQAGSSLVGNVFGSFYGISGQKPDEVGLSYYLASPTYQVTLTGVAVGGATTTAAALPPPPPTATPPVSPPPPPPPSPPPPPVPPTPPGSSPGSSATCAKAKCLTGKTYFNGPSTLIQVRNANPGVATPIAGTRIDTVTANTYLMIDPKGTASESDDIYSVKYMNGGNVYERNFSLLRPVSNVLGSLKVAAFADGYTDSFFLVDLDSVLAQAADYVQIAAFSREIVPTGAELAFITFGRLTDAKDMPTSGTASYAGQTRGIYVTSGGDVFDTASSIDMTANFGTGKISGLASNFKLMNSSGNLVTRSEKLDFLYSADINSGTATFSGTAISAFPTSAGGLGITGQVEGAFFGPKDAPPAAAGLTYKLGVPVTGSFMSGGAVLEPKP